MLKIRKLIYCFTIVICTFGVVFPSIQFATIKMITGDVYDVIGFEKVDEDIIFLNIVEYHWKAGEKLYLSTGSEFNIGKTFDMNIPKQSIGLNINKISAIEVVKYDPILQQSFNFLGMLIGGVISGGITNEILPMVFGAAAGYYLLGNFTKGYWRTLLVNEDLIELTSYQKI